MTVAPKRLLPMWEAARTGYWLVPSLMALAAAGLAVVLLAVDHAHEFRLPIADWLYLSDPEGARSVLSTIAGSMITVAGVVFSITIVSLVLASSQYGPRLLRAFMRDPLTQIVLGTFVATYAYCLLVLRAVGSGSDPSFVPDVALTGGIVLAVVSLGVLIFFIHHVASSIQATTIADGLAKELDHVIQRLFPEQPGGDAPSAGLAGGDDASAGLLPPGFAGSAQAIAAPADGYVQAADDDLLVALAERHDLVLRLEHRPGRFVIAGDPLLLAWPGERVDHARAQEILAAFVLGQQRTPPQDAEFVLDQIVEMAVRALSPGINDPFTAITCIDRMGQILARLGPRPMPTPFRRDRAGRVRLVAAPETFERLADGIFDPLRHYGRCHPMVLIRLLDVLGHAAAHAVEPARREVLRRHADAILEEGRDALSHPRDRELLEAHHRRAAAALCRERGRAEAAAPAPAPSAPRPSRRAAAVEGTGFGSRR